jgi:hypothetical protein
MKAALEDLLTVAPPERQAPLERQLALLDAAVADNDWSKAERAELLSSDTQGIGSAPEFRAIAGQ